jgi:hypothetical protein
MRALKEARDAARAARVRLRVCRLP